MQGTVRAGSFTTVTQKRLYEQGEGIRKAALKLAERFQSLDDSAADANRPTPGSVLLDGWEDAGTLSGFCRFDPTTRQVESLDAELVASPDSPTAFDYVTPRHERVHIETGRPGVTYRTSEGTMRVNPDGSIFVDTEARLPVTWEPRARQAGDAWGGPPEVATVRQSYADYLAGR